MEKPDTEINCLTVGEAAVILKTCKRTVGRMILDGRIPAFKVGMQWRILESQFQEWIRDQALHR